MGGEDAVEGLIPFESIVRRGVLLREIDCRRQALVGQCRACNGLTLQEVVDHNDWLLQVERDLSKARSRIEREFRISNALSLKVREGKRKAQLQQRLDVLRSQCDVLNECIHGLSDHCAWFQESGTYREAADYLESRWDEDDGSVEEAHFDLRVAAAGGCVVVGGHRPEVPSLGLGNTHHDLDGLIQGDAQPPSGEKKQAARRKRRKGKKAGAGGGAGGGCGGPPDETEGRTENSDDDEDAERDGAAGAQSGDADGAPAAFWAVPDLQWLRSSGLRASAAAGGEGAAYVDVWAPD